MHVDRHVFFLQARNVEGDVDVIRSLVAMYVHHVSKPELVVFHVLELTLACMCLSLGLGATFVGGIHRQRSDQGRNSAKGIVFVEEVMHERHLVADMVKVVAQER